MKQTCHGATDSGGMEQRNGEYEFTLGPFSLYLMDICPFQFCFFDHFARVYANSINFGTRVRFYWNFTFSPTFHLFYTSIAKLLLLGRGPFNSKMMKSLLIGFILLARLTDGAIYLRIGI